MKFSEIIFFFVVFVEMRLEVCFFLRKLSCHFSFFSHTRKGNLLNESKNEQFDVCNKKSIREIAYKVELVVLMNLFSQKRRVIIAL